METLMSNFKRYSILCGIFFLGLSLSNCSSDDDVVTPDEDPTGTITASDQRISGNTLIINNVSVDQDSWLVARNADDDTEIVSDTVFIEEGPHSNVELTLHNTANLTGNADGDDFVVSIYADNPNEGVQGEFDAGIDDPIEDNTGTAVSQNVNVTGPTLTAEDDQTVTDDNMVTFSNVNTVNDGWIALYGQDAEGNINEDDLIGTQYVEAGDYTDFTVPFNEDYTYTPGSTVYPRLYMDDPADQTFTFTAGGTEDLPESYGYDANTGEGAYVGNTGTTTGGFTVQ